MIPYRGFEIHVVLAPSSEDLYDVSFQIKRGTNIGVHVQNGRASVLRSGRSHDAGAISSRSGSAKRQLMFSAVLQTTNSGKRLYRLYIARNT
ncbi:hypothetical protein BSFA1_85810 (plasmid) [Burkholderia sp. SFA1]|nr:hypothetical protein BSFA1_85810 [Burkholderia sp. SFA1]